MMNTYKIEKNRNFQVIIRKATSRAGLVTKKFFETEEEAYKFADQYSHAYGTEVRNLEYFKPL